jgi:cytoskeleton protein RodZ
MQSFLRHEIDPATPDAAATASRRQGSVGDLLRQTRQSYGGSLEQIADALRIRVSYLAAIEEARYADLPGPVYAQGFVRAYATHMGLDAEEAVRRFKLETAAFEKPRDLTFPMPLTQRSIPGGSMVLAALILALCGYGVWYYLSTGDRARPERVSAVPANLLPAPVDTPPAAPTTAVAATPPAVSVTASPVASATAAVPPTAPAAAVAPQAVASPQTITSPQAVTASPLPSATAAATSPAGSGTANTAPGQMAAATPPPASPALSQTTPAAAPATSVPASTTTGKVYGTEGSGRVVIHITDDSWVQVRDADQALLLTRTLHAGDVYYVPDKPGISLRTGNAGALSITVDGHPAPAVGGRLRRNVLLDPERLMAGTAVAE